ncbi:UNVERIFIED_CONTAM: hypothetical protein FKN15_068963 [Acipenser sinensis]
MAVMRFTINMDIQIIILGIWTKQCDAVELLQPSTHITSSVKTMSKAPGNVPRPAPVSVAPVPAFKSTAAPVAAKSAGWQLTNAAASGFQKAAPNTGHITSASGHVSNSSIQYGAKAPPANAMSRQAPQPHPKDQDTLVQRAEHIPAGTRTPMCGHCKMVISSIQYGAKAPPANAMSRQAPQPHPKDQDTLVQRAEHIPAGTRTPMCGHCKMVIRGPFLVAMGKSWHPEEFTCAHCKNSLADTGFVEEKGSVYCEHCYEEFFAPTCGRCQRKIIGEIINALKQTWHVHCFLCTSCHQPIRNNVFHLEDGEPYCEQGPFLVAMGKSWHPEEFTCAHCKNSLADTGFVEEKGSVYCEHCYEEFFAPTCGRCQRKILGEIINALKQTWHVHCFLCTSCHQPIRNNVFHLEDGEPYCEQERLKNKMDDQLVLLSDDAESKMPVAQLSLSAELMPLMQQATAVLQVLWPMVHTERRSIYDEQPTVLPAAPPVHPDFLGPFLVAMGKSWHPEEFTCAHCKNSLADTGFVEEKGSVYCEHCYEKFFAPTCGRCQRKIIGEIINALKQTWHVHCFLCTSCHQPIRNNVFHLEDGEPYCEQERLKNKMDDQLVLLSDDAESKMPVAQLSLSAELMPLMQQATAVLQVLWPMVHTERRSIYDEQPTVLPAAPPVHPDFLYELQSTWAHPATAVAVSRPMDSLYRVSDADKLGLTHFPPVEASIAALVQPANLSLLSKDAACPNKQCRVTEVILKKAYTISAFSARLGSYNSILVAYQAHLIWAIAETHKSLSLQLDELCLILRNVLRLSKLSGQAIGRNLASLVAAHRQLWLSRARVLDGDKTALLDAPVTPGRTFGPAVDKMLQQSQRARKSTRELVHLLPKCPPPPCKPAAQWHPRPQLQKKPAPHNRVLRITHAIFTLYSRYIHIKNCK